MWILGFLSSSLGILIGGIIAWFFKGLQQKVEIIYGLCAGIILGLISFEILPESIELGGVLKTFVGFVMGIVLFKVLHDRLHNYQWIKGISKKKAYIHTSILLMLSFSIHNVPIGIILATSQESDVKVALLQTLLFHSIPEGILLFTPLILAGIGLSTGLFISFIISIPVLLGILIGGYLQFDYQSINSTIISVTLGMIFMVTVSEMLYPALSKSSVFKVLFCVLIGLVLIAIYLTSVT